MAVYFVRAKGTNRVKIGYTKSCDPTKRLHQLKTSCADDLTIVQCYGDGDRGLEKQFHKQFERSHIKREWFYYRPEISEFLGDCNLDKPEVCSAPAHIIALQDKTDIAHFRITEQSMEGNIGSRHAALLYMALNYALLNGEEELYHFFDSAHDVVGDLNVLSPEEMGFILHKRMGRARRAGCGSRRT